MNSTGVLIVGAGPTGFTLACDLARRGVSVRIIDKAPRFAVGSRGKGLQPRSLEVLDDLGVVEKILASGNSHLIFRQYRREEVIREVDLSAGRRPTPDVPYPNALLIAQWRVEEILRDRLAELCVAVELGSELVEFTRTDSAVVATVVRADGSERIEAGYLVGCDGGRSDVRKSLGVRFDGDTNVTQQLLCGDVEVDGLAPDAWHQWFTGEHLMLLCPLPGTRSWQFQASSPVDADGRLEEPSLEGFQRIVDERTGLPIRLHSPTWLSTYRANVRMVERFRVGRVLLAGDAAHVHPIAGGLGMNTGIQDAYNLGWKLGLVLAGTADDTLLDTYEAERLPIAAWTLNTSSDSARAMLDAARKGSGGVDAGLTVDTRQLGLHYRWSPLARDLIDRGDRLRAGDRAPDAPVQLAATGAPTRLFDVFRGPHLTVLGFGDECAGVLDELAGAGGAVRTCLVSPSGGHAFRAYEVASGTLVVVRPDGYLGLTAAAFDAGAVRDYLKGLVVQPS